MNQLFGLQHRRGLTLLCHDLSRPPQRGGGPGGQGWPREA